MSSKSCKDDALASADDTLRLELRKEDAALASRREWAQMVVRRLTQIAAGTKPDVASSEAS